MDFWCFLVVSSVFWWISEDYCRFALDFWGFQVFSSGSMVFSSGILVARRLFAWFWSSNNYVSFTFMYTFPAVLRVSFLEVFHSFIVFPTQPLKYVLELSSDSCLRMSRARADLLPITIHRFLIHHTEENLAPRTASEEVCWSPRSLASLLRMGGCAVSPPDQILLRLPMALDSLSASDLNVLLLIGAMSWQSDSSRVVFYISSANRAKNSLVIAFQNFSCPTPDIFKKWTWALPQIPWNGKTTLSKPGFA